MHVAQQPAVIDVADDQLDRLEGEIGVRRVVHRQDHAGQDLHAQHEGEDGAEGPPVVQVTRRRIGHERGMHEAQNRQSPFEPLQGWVARLVVGGSAHDAILRKVKRRDGVEGPGSWPRGLSRSGFCYRKEKRRAARQVERRRPLADTAGGVVLRAVAGAEEAVVIALMGDRDAAEMGADADHDQPLVMAFLDAGLVGGGVLEIAERRPSGPPRSASWSGA